MLNKRKRGDKVEEEGGGDIPLRPKTILKNHQIKGVEWMEKREREEFSGCWGGLLCDPTGLGKTIQFLTLVRNTKDKDLSGDNSTSFIGARYRQTTVFVCSTLVVNNCKDEISRFYPELKVLSLLPEDLKKTTNTPPPPAEHKKRKTVDEKGEVDPFDCDIIMVSFGQVKAAWRGVLQKIKLIAMKEVQNESDRVVKNVEYMFRLKKMVEMVKMGSNTEELIKPTSLRERLFCCGGFRRMVIDEAHIARNIKGPLFTSLLYLNARCRWVITATPLNNSGTDIYAMLRLAGINTWQTLRHWKKENAPFYQSESAQKGLSSTNKTPSEYQKLLGVERKKSLLLGCSTSEAYTNDCYLASSYCYGQTVLSKVMMRRKKEEIMQKDPSMKLETPDVIDASCKDFANPSERQLHDHFYQGFVKKFESESQKKLGKIKEEEDESKKKKGKTKKKNTNGKKARKDEDDEEEDVDDFHCILTDNNDEEEEDKKGEIPKKRSKRGKPSFKTASQTVLASFGLARSACCVPKEVAKAGQRKVPKSVVESIASIKIENLTKNRVILEMLEKRVPKDDNSVVFVHWLAQADELKDIIEKRTGRKCYVLTGKMSSEDRWKSIRKSRDSKGSVLIASINITAFGINLSFANHVFFPGPWFNPQIRRQAMDRVWRYGQTKKVCVYDLSVQDTIEDRIIQLQKQKLQLSKNNVDDLKQSNGNDEETEWLDDEDVDIIEDVLTLDQLLKIPSVGT